MFAVRHCASVLYYYFQARAIVNNAKPGGEQSRLVVTKLIREAVAEADNCGCRELSDQMRRLHLDIDTSNNALAKNGGEFKLLVLNAKSVLA